MMCLTAPPGGVPWVLLAAVLLIGVTLPGCEVGPDYHRPSASVPAHWDIPATTQSSVTVQNPVQIEAWWQEFHDPELSSLIRRADVANLILESAAERILQARAEVGIANAGRFPNANLNGSYTRSAQSNARPQNLWQAGLDSSWELDLFGGIRRGVESANANLDAAVEDRRDVLVILRGEVATDYVLLRGQQQEIIIAQQNLRDQEKNVQLTRQKKTLGTGTDLDIVQAQEQVSSTTASIESFNIAAQQEIYAISFLLGLAPSELDAELRPPDVIPQAPAIVNVGLPSDLLRRRPDIRRAERQLAAATAQIGVATADLFPKFSLSGSFSSQGIYPQSLGNLNNTTWSIGPSFSWTVFDAGQIRSNIEVQNQLEAQAMTTYKQAVLIALQDVQNALVAYSGDQRRRDVLAEGVALNQRALQLATQRYNQGLTDFLNVLVAEQGLLSAQDALVQSNRDVVTDAIALYKSLGGGWASSGGGLASVDGPPATPPAQR